MFSEDCVDLPGNLTGNDGRNRYLSEKAFLAFKTMIKTIQSKLKL